jgi:hypothetical protein
VSRNGRTPELISTPRGASSARNSSTAAFDGDAAEGLFGLVAQDVGAAGEGRGADGEDGEEFDGAVRESGGEESAGFPRVEEGVGFKVVFGDAGFVGEG